MRERAEMRKWYWQLGQTFSASSTTLRKSMSPHSGQRVHNPSGMPARSRSPPASLPAPAPPAGPSVVSLKPSPPLGTCDIRNLASGVILQPPPQFRNRRGAVGLVEYCAGDDEPVHAGLRRERNGFGVDAAVDLQPLVRPEPLLDGPRLREDLRH